MIKAIIVQCSLKRKERERLIVLVHPHGPEKFTFSVFNLNGQWRLCGCRGTQMVWAYEEALKQAARYRAGLRKLHREATAKWKKLDAK